MVITSGVSDIGSQKLAENLLGNGLKMIQDRFNPNAWHLGDFHIVPDEEYLEWLNDKIESLYGMEWQNSADIESKLDFFENEYVECSYRLGISGRLR
jgi:hypothetical protein